MIPDTKIETVNRNSRPQRPPGRRLDLTALLVAMRPLHWVKSVFVLVPLAFAGRLMDPVAVFWSLLALVLFALASSAVYLINDVFDRAEDSRHPSKRFRPVTCGRLSVNHAVAFAAVLGAGASLVSIILNVWFGLVVVSYLILNVAYSAYLKRVVIADVIIVAVGFIMRVIAGAYVLQYETSTWILVCTFGLALLIGFSKRRYEIMMDGSSIQYNRGYSPYFLDLLIVLSGATILSAYVFYILSRGSWQNGAAILASILVVFYGVMRYVFLIHRSEENLDHTKLILTDKPLMAATLVWILLLITEIYIYNPHLYHH